MTPLYITIHSTANLKSTAKNERDNLARIDNNAKTGFHIVVDDKEAIECIPLNEVAWANGDGYNGTGNRKSISIEICESGDREKTINNAIQITKKIMRVAGINKIKRHYDWSGKICPRIFQENNWEQWNKFLEKVTRE